MSELRPWQCLSFRYPALEDVAASFSTILERLAAALNVTDLTVAGGTDLALNGRKVSGNAQRRGRRALLHHGTLLYAFDASLAARYLRDPRSPACVPSRSAAHGLPREPSALRERPRGPLDGRRENLCKNFRSRLRRMHNGAHVPTRDSLHLQVSLASRAAPTRLAVAGCPPRGRAVARDRPRRNRQVAARAAVAGRSSDPFPPADGHRHRAKGAGGQATGSGQRHRRVERHHRQRRHPHRQ